MNLQLFPSKFIGPLSARCSHKEHDEILNKKVRAIVYSLPLATREKEDHKGLSSTGCSIRKLPQAILCDLFSHGIKKLEFLRRPLIPLRDPCASIVQPPSVAFGTKETYYSAARIFTTIFLTTLLPPGVILGRCASVGKKRKNDCGVAEDKGPSAT